MYELNYIHLQSHWRSSYEHTVKSTYFNTQVDSIPRAQVRSEIATYLGGLPVQLWLLRERRALVSRLGCSCGGGLHSGTDVVGREGLGKGWRIGTHTIFDIQRKNFRDGIT